jgi:3-isopropylmalate/(R)-2-methylmalate dehydratase large subunit
VGKTLAEKILQAKAATPLEAGEIAIVPLDFVMAQDGTAPLAIESFREMGGEKVFDPKKIAFVIDHSAPPPNLGVSLLHQKMRDFAKKQGIILYEVGEGVCHQLLPEKGHVVPGDVVVGADSHTCTYGALGAFATGVGSTDLAASMISGKIWFKVPQSIKLVLKGKLPQGVFSKDLALFLIGKITADGAGYKAVEFEGEAVETLSMEERFTLSNMAVEMGAKVGLIAPDDKCLSWAKNHSSREPQIFKADYNANYENVLEFDVSLLSPCLAKPHRVDNLAFIEELEGTAIQQAFLGTCTNGRLNDLEIAAQILRGRKVHPDVRFIVAPASRKVFLKATRRGVIEALVEAGAAVVTPGCGCCVGTHNGIPADGEVVISTANRNFKGRMGNPNAFIYLASPATVAASAIEGKIADPRKYLREAR